MFHWKKVFDIFSRECKAHSVSNWDFNFLEDSFNIQMWKGEEFDSSRLITVRVFRSGQDANRFTPEEITRFESCLQDFNAPERANDAEVTVSYRNEEDFDEEEIEEVISGQIDNLDQFKEYNNADDEQEDNKENDHEERDENEEFYSNPFILNENEIEESFCSPFRLGEEELIIFIICVSDSIEQNQIYFVEPRDIPPFFQKHKMSKFVVENCIEFFKILRHFMVHCDQFDISSPEINGEEDEWIWELVNDGRLFDLRILDCLTNLAVQNKKCNLNLPISIIKNVTSIRLTTFVNQQRRKIQKFIEQYLLSFNQNLYFESVELFQSSSLFEIFQTLLITQSIISVGIKNAYLVLANKARHLMQYYSNLIYKDAETSYGLLTQTIQVKAAIASSMMTNIGITVYHKEIIMFHIRVNQLIEEETKLLMELDLSRNLFYLDEFNGKVKRINDRIATPKINYERLQEILTFIQSDILYRYNIKIPTIHVNVEQVFNLRLIRWKCYAHLHPFISRWIQFQKSMYFIVCVEHYLFLMVKLSPKPYNTIYEFIDDNLHLVDPSLNANTNDKGLQSTQPNSCPQSSEFTQLHPQWNFLLRNGRMGCKYPNVPFTPKEMSFRRIIKPSPGNVLLVVDYSFIELCTLSAVCEQRFSYSNLGKVIRSGADPHCYTAALFSGIDLSLFEKKLKEYSQEKGDPKIREDVQNIGQSDDYKDQLGYNTSLNQSSNNYTLSEDPETSIRERRENYQDIRNLSKIMNFSVASGIGVRSLQILIFNILAKEFVEISTK